MSIAFGNNFFCCANHAFIPFSKVGPKMRFHENHAMAGYSLSVQPRTNALLKIFAEDNICSLIINVKPELKLSNNSVPIDPPSALLLQIYLLGTVHECVTNL
jgi:hypothetical protein